MSRCAASATSLPVGGYPASEPGPGTVLVLARVQGQLSEAVGSGGQQPFRDIPCIRGITNVIVKL